MNRLRLATMQVGLVAAATLALCGCSDDTPAVPSVGDLMARSDGDEADKGETAHGPTTLTPGGVGHIEIEDFFVGAVFWANGAILRVRSHPECVVLLNPNEARFAFAGTLTVSSDLVGTPGGPSAPLVIHPDRNNEYYEFPDPPLFNYPDGSKVQFALTGSSVNPAVAPTSLRSPPFGPVNVTAPTVPDSLVLPVSSTEPLKFKWDVPATQRHPPFTPHPQSVFVRFFAFGPVQWAQAYCSWPISAGHGSVPAVLLSEMRAQLGGTGALDAYLDVLGGELKEIATPTSSCVAFVTTDNATTFPRTTFAPFD